MIDYQYQGTQGNLRLEKKTGWARGVLDEDTLFIHGSSVTPAKIRVFGISPLYAGEFLVNAADDTPIGGGKMIFAFKTVAGTAAPASFRRPAAVTRLFGDAGYAYIFEAPAGTVFYTKGGVVNPGQEIAFPYIIENADLRYYLDPGSTTAVRWPDADTLDWRTTTPP